MATENIPSLATQEIVSGRWPVALVVGLGLWALLTKGICSGHQLRMLWLAKVRPYRVKPRFRVFSWPCG